jgi:hypothetical protein
MGVDFNAYMIYGYALDQDKFIEFLKEKEKENPEFNFYDWKEDLELESRFFYENHYDDIDSEYNQVYFGIWMLRSLKLKDIQTIDSDFHDVVQDELVSIFGSSFDIVGGSQYLEPELISIGVID